MKNAEQHTGPLDRELALGKLLLTEHNKKPSSISVILDFKNLLRTDSFSDLDVIRRGLNQLKKSIGADFEFEILTQKKALSVADTDLAKLPDVPFAYKVTMDDWNSLLTHVASLKEKAKKNSYEFYLIDVSKNESELRLVGSDKKAPRMRKNLRRYKILRYLAEKKGKVKTARLADEFEITETEVRDTVTVIKDIVAKAFKIPRSAIFENDQTGTGYAVNNITLK